MTSWKRRCVANAVASRAFIGQQFNQPSNQPNQPTNQPTNRVDDVHKNNSLMLIDVHIGCNCAMSASVERKVLASSPLLWTRRNPLSPKRRKRTNRTEKSAGPTCCEQQPEAPTRTNSNMRLKKLKAARKTMAFFRVHFKVRPPFKLLMDGCFLHNAHKIEFVRLIEQLLQAEVRR